MSKWTGILQLTVEIKNEKTVPKRVYFQGAFKVMRPNYLDNTGQACYFLINPGGGYVDGDRYRMEITLEERAELLLTTQSATKIYRTPNIPIIQDTEILLKKNSVLEFLPDPLIGYKNARYKQHNVIRMETGATLIYSDILTPGWSPDGELFSYDLLQFKNEIYLDNQLIVFDHLKLEPAKQNIESIGMMEGYTHLGSMIVISNKANQDELTQIHMLLEENMTDCIIGLSQLSVPGFTLRILANTTQSIEKVFAECHTFIRKHWFGKEATFLRKY